MTANEPTHDGAEQSTESSSGVPERPPARDLAPDGLEARRLDVDEESPQSGYSRWYSISDARERNASDLDVRAAVRAEELPRLLEDGARAAAEVADRAIAQLVENDDRADAGRADHAEDPPVRADGGRRRRHGHGEVFQRIADTLDPDADEQRWYSCKRCGWACINPVGTVPEENDWCLDCAASRLTLDDLDADRADAGRADHAEDPPVRADGGQCRHGPAEAAEPVRATGEFPPASEVTMADAPTPDECDHPPRHQSPVFTDTPWTLTYCGGCFTLLRENALDECRRCGREADLGRYSLCGDCWRQVSEGSR